AIVGVCFGILALGLFIASYIVDGIEIINPVMDYELVSKLLAALGFLCLLMTSGLGWIAVSQIRRSAGKLYGMWLAVFDGLLFPLLALDGVIFGGYVAALIALHLKPGIILLPPMLLAILALDWLIIRRVWRAVNQSSAGVPLKPASDKPKSGAGKAITIGGAVLAVV